MPLEKGQAPLEKGQTYIEHFPAREDALLISESGCVPPEVMVLNTNPLVLYKLPIKEDLFDFKFEATWPS